MYKNIKNVNKLNIKYKKGRIKRFMENDKNKGFYYTDMDEDVTKYGEFVSSYFAWVPPEKQKKRAKELDEKTKKKK